jgi:hypothetical protein
MGAGPATCVIVAERPPLGLYTIKQMTKIVIAHSILLNVTVGEDVGSKEEASEQGEGKDGVGWDEEGEDGGGWDEEGEDGGGWDEEGKNGGS